MAGYIGANTSSVTNNQNAAERRKKFTFTANTTVLSGLNFAPAKIHIFHNGIRLVKDTDFTEASDGKSVTLTNAAQAGDEVVAVTFAQDPASNSDFVSAATGGTFSGDVTMASGTTLDASAGTFKPSPDQVIQVATFKSSTATSISTTSTVTISALSASIVLKTANPKLIYSATTSQETDITANNVNGFFRLSYSINSGSYTDTSEVITHGSLADPAGGTGNNSITFILEGVTLAAGDTVNIRIRYNKTDAGNMQFNQQPLTGQPSSTSIFCQGHIMEIAQ
jgi:hypothetical protein